MSEATKWIHVRLTVALVVVVALIGGTAQAAWAARAPKSPRGFSIGDATIVEGDTSSKQLLFTVTLNGGSTKTATVRYATAGRSATAPADFAPTSGLLTFPKGTLTRQVAVTVFGDLVDEPNETLAVSLSGATRTKIIRAQGTGTITDDDPAPVVRIGGASVAEGESGASAVLAFPVELDRPSGVPVTVRYATSDGTAKAPADYIAASATLTFEPGQTKLVAPVTVVGDALPDGDEDLHVTLSAPQNAALGAPSSAVGRIIDNDPLTNPRVTIGDAENAEGATFTFELSFSPVPPTAFQLVYDVVADTAETPADLAPVAGGVITVPAGAPLVNLTVSTTEDALHEADEDFFVNLRLGDPSGGASIADGQALGTIIDDDPVPSVSVSDTEVSEGDTVATPNYAFFPVVLSAPSGLAVTVHYATGDGTATAGVDYIATSGDLTFPPGVTEQSIAVPVMGNLEDGENTSFALTLSAATGASIGDATATATIVDDEAAELPTISVDDPTVTEGDAAAAFLPFTVQLSDFSDDVVSVDYTVSSPGTASLHGTVTFEPGETADVVGVSVPGNTTVNPDLVYTLTLANPHGGVLSATDKVGTGTVVDNDTAPPVATSRISVADAAIVEGDSSPSVLQFVVTLDQPAATAGTVDYATAGLSASPGEDFLPASDTLHFVAGQQSKIVLVVVQPDLETEADETLLLNLTNPSAGLVIGDGQAVGTITDDDPEPSAPLALSIGDAVAREGATPTTADFTVSLSAPAPAGGVAFSWTTSVGTADGEDFATAPGTGTIPASAQSATIAIPVFGDSRDEDATETFAVHLATTTSGIVVDRGQGLGTIIDNEALLPQLSLGDVTVHHGPTSDTVVLTIPVSIDRASDDDITVDYSIPSPTGGEPITGTIVIPAGQTSVVAEQTVTGDLQTVASSVVTITDVTGAVLDPTSASTTPRIVPVVRIDEVVVTDGSTPGTSIVVVTVTLDEASDEDLSVEVSVPPVDPSGTPTTITIVVPAGETSGQGSTVVPGSPQDVAGSDVTIVGVSNGGEVSPTDGSATPVVVDLPVVRIDEVLVTPGPTSGTSIVEVTVSIDEASDVDVAVGFTVPGPPPVTGIVVIPAGSTTASGSVVVPGTPTEVAASEVTLTDASGAVIDPSGSSATPVVVDHPGVTIDDVVVNDGPTPGTSIVIVTVTLDEPSTTPVTVEYSVPPAVPGGQPTTGTITIPAGSVTGSGSVVVPGTPAEVAGSDVTLTGADGAVLDPTGSSATPTVTDLPVVHLGDVTVTDGATPGSVVVVIPVTLDEPSSVPVTVTYSIPSTTGGAPTTGTITFPPGSISETVQVTVPGTTGQVSSSPVTLQGVTNGVLDPADASDVPAVVDLPVVTIGEVTVSPGTQPGTVVVTIPVTIDQPTNVPVTVDYSIPPAAGGGAPTTGTITIPPGSTSGSATVTVPGNTTTQVPGPVTITDSTGSVINPGDASDHPHVVPAPSGSGSGAAGAGAGSGAGGQASSTTPASTAATPVVDRFTRVATGYRMVASDGGIFTFGDAPFLGSTGDIKLNQPIVGMATTPSGDGYWLVASDGGIFTFGDANFYGSTGAIKLNKPIVGMETTPTGKGYWLVATDGGIFAFGDAEFLGSTGDIRLNQPIVGMETSPTGNGYWLAARDGGIFAFGDAGFHGSTGAIRLNQPIVGMAASPSGQGYRLVATDGGIFAFGDASFLGSTGDIKLNKPIVGLAVAPSGNGYWLVATDGGIFTFGDAQFLGSTGDLRLNQPINGMAPVVRTTRAG